MKKSSLYLPGLTAPPEQRIIKSAIPSWMPQELVTALQETGMVRFAFSKGERQVLRRRRPIPVSEWTERHRHVRMSSIPGKWHNIFTPYLTGIMDTAAFPGVETVILCKAPQTGGSEAGHNIIGYAIDRAPGPAMYVFPDENTARENAKDRIIPMIEDSSRLREYLTGYGDDLASLRISLTTMPIYLGWSGSVARLGNRPIRYLILDELDKYKNPRNEAPSEALAEKRTTTWGRRRIIFKLSTPTREDGPIWKAFTEEANCRFDFWVRCAHCNFAQLMKFDNIRWPENVREPEVVLSERLAEYACELCGAMWDDTDRDRAVRRGEWRERSSGLELLAHLKLHRPLKVGFHLPAWLSYFVSLSEVAHAFLKWHKSQKLEDLKNFANQYKAEPWKEQYAERREDAVLALCDSRPRGIVPIPEEHAEPDKRRPPIAALLAAVDTQQRYFRYVIRAFAYGKAEESWLIQAGSVNNFDDLNLLLWQSVYKDGHGKEYRVRSAIIDAMGNRTSEVYRYCVQHRGRIIPYQGVRSLSAPILHAPQEFFPDEKGNKIKIPGGLLLHRVDTTFFKGDLAAKLAVALEDPGAFHLHDNAKNELVEYAKEMCAEVWSDEEQAWINPRQRPNHFWDCEVMLQALAYQLGIRNWKEPGERNTPSKPPPPLPGQGRVRSAAELLAGIRR